MSLQQRSRFRFPFLNTSQESVLIVGLFICYGYALLSKLEWNEEYACLVSPSSCAYDQIGDLRPIYGLTSYVFYSVSNFLNTISFYRLFGFLGFALLHLVIFRSLSNRTHPNSHNALVFAVLATSTMPSFMTMAISPNIAIYSWSSLAAIVATNYILDNKKQFLIYVLLVLSLLSYPPSTYFAFTYFAVNKIVGGIQNLRSMIISLLRIIRFVFLSTMIALIIAVLILCIFDLPRKSRVSLIQWHEWDEKVSFVMTRFVPTSFRGFQISSPSFSEALFSLLVGTSVLLISLLYLSQRNVEIFMFYTLFLTCCCFISLTPFILSSGNEIDFRMVRNSSWAIWFILLFAFANFLVSKSVIYSPSALLTCYALLLTLLLGLFTINNWRYFVYFKLPYDEKTLFIETQLIECYDSKLKNLASPIGFDLPAYARYSNIGIFSLVTDLSQSWVPEANVKLVKRRITQSRLDIRNNKLKSCNVDLSKFQPSRFADR